VNARHKKVLQEIKGYFGVGTLFHSGKNAGYRVGSVIIPKARVRAYVLFFELN
jgi:ribosomal protein L20